MPRRDRKASPLVSQERLSKKLREEKRNEGTDGARFIRKNRATSLAGVSRDQRFSSGVRVPSAFALFKNENISFKVALCVREPAILYGDVFRKIRAFEIERASSDLIM